MRSIFRISVTPAIVTVLVAAGALFSLLDWFREPIGRLDLVAYVSGFDLFLNGGNPYSSVQLYEKEQELGVARNFAVSMWNPPIFFSFFAPILAISPDLAPSASRALSFACLLLLAYLGYRLSPQSNSARIGILAYLISAIGLLPAWEEVRLGQNTSWVALAVAVGCYCMLRAGHSALAGALLAVSLCKPHNFFLPLMVVAYRVIRTRDWRALGGGFISLLMAGVVPEILHPGIWSAWLFREQWPYHPHCANFSTALVLAIDGATVLHSWLIYSISISIGFLVWAVGVSRYRLVSPESQIMWAWLVTPFFAPYGFLSDHVTLVFPLAYFAGWIGSQHGPESQARFLMTLLLISIGGLLLPVNSFNGESLSWFIFAPATLIAVSVTLSQTDRKACGSAP